jgi:hypothetical protein
LKAVWQAPGNNTQKKDFFGLPFRFSGFLNPSPLSAPMLPCNRLGPILYREVSLLALPGSAKPWLLQAGVLSFGADSFTLLILKLLLMF